MSACASAAQETVASATLDEGCVLKLAQTMAQDGGECEMLAEALWLMAPVVHAAESLSHAMRGITNATDQDARANWLAAAIQANRALDAQIVAMRKRLISGPWTTETPTAWGLH